MYKKLSTILLTTILGLGTLSLAACGNDDSAEQNGQKSDSVAESMQKQADEQKKKDNAMEEGADKGQNTNEKASQAMKKNDEMSN